MLKPAGHIRPLRNAWFFLVLVFLFSVFFHGSAQAAQVHMTQSALSLGKENEFWVGIHFTLHKGEKVLAAPVAPTLTLEERANIQSFQLFYPPASVDKSQGTPIQAFHESFTIPVKVILKTPGKPIRFSGNLDYITCETSCVPQKSSFLITMKEGPFLKTSDGDIIRKAYTHIIQPSPLSLTYLAWFAFLGGIILNLMPCVLPVLGLKFLSVMSSKKHALPRIGFLITILGILTSFWCLCGLAILLKSLGLQVGWGMHFQEPVFLVLMIVTMLIFSLNLFGAFEIHLPPLVNRWIDRLSVKSKNHLLSSYVSGIFATLLATPCTAPFLGVSVGFALTQSAGPIFLIFTLIALGFSLPYWILLLLPARWIPHPKPGPWMMWVKGAMGALLLITAAWLGTVLYAQIKTETGTIHGEETLWHPFEPEKIETLVKKGHVVVVNVTAQWCLTCKVNERHFRKGRELYQLLKSDHVYPMKADWTNRNGTIASFLETHRRSGIPFTVIFGPQAPEGIVLPEILTIDHVEKAMKRAGL